MWAAFVDHIVDTAFVRGCVGSPTTRGPTRAGDNAADRRDHHFRMPAAKRLVAIGDLHGDLQKALQAFRVAGLTDAHDRWNATDTVCVQVGDILDRGDDELRVLYLLERLQQEATAAGCALHVLNGNHETMNIGGNYKYATAGASAQMREWCAWQRLGDKLRAHCGTAALLRADSQTGGAGQEDGTGRHDYDPIRHECLTPGGPVTTRFLAHHPIVLQVGSTIFAHGGVLPSHIEYGLDKINREATEWMMGIGTAGATQALPNFLRGSSAIVWARDYSRVDAGTCDCGKLEDVLQSISGARRMVVGHTIQREGINSACNEKVFRVDVGMSRGCGDGTVQALEISDDYKTLNLSA